MEPKKHSIVSGTLLTVAMRWSDRLIGLISLLILARLLIPEDFGVIALASLVVGFTAVVFDVSVNIALIQNQQATKEHYDSAWTLRLIQSFVVTLILVLLAPWAASYFNDLRIEPVLKLLAVSLLIGGFENIGIISFQKNMQFGAEFRFLFTKRVVKFVVTIVLAFLMHSYWALVYGALVGSMVGVWLSYQVHPMRPRFSFIKMKEILSVSQWMLLNSIGGYLNNNLHKVFMGRLFSSATMGAYTLADEIASIPTSELLAPLNRVLFPAFAEVKEDLDKLKEMLLLAQGVQILVAMPAAVGLTLVANEAVAVLLGSKWAIVTPFLQVLAIVGITQAVGTSSGYILLVLGKFKEHVMTNWAQVLLFLVLVLLLVQNESDPIDIVYLRLLVAISGIGIIFYLVTRALPIVSILDLMRSFIRPLLGVIAMSIVLTSLPEYANFPVWILLFIKVFLGAFIYISTVFLLWWFIGKPSGAESYIFNKIEFVRKKVFL